MTDKIIETIRRQIEDAGIEIIDLLENYDKLPGQTAQQRLAAARYKFCWNIHQIRYHNAGILPPDMLQEWHMNMCDSYNFTV
jgi:hypothetical protein